MRPRPPLSHSPSRYASDISSDILSVPINFDWTQNETPVVTPVRDQGTVGSCWAFSTVQNIEGQWALSGHSLTELSVEQIVDCDGSTDPKTNNSDCGVFGGWPYLAYGYVQRAGGLETEQQYPYCCGTGDCYPCMAPGSTPDNCGPPPEYCNATQNQCTNLTPYATISDWTAISTNETQILLQLYQRGPLSVLLNSEFLSLYSSGVWDPLWCDPTELDHAVLLVGWGVLNNTDYWIVKNSWGTDWGLEGYFWIQRGSGMCGINTAVTSSIV